MPLFPCSATFLNFHDKPLWQAPALRHTAMVRRVRTNLFSVDIVLHTHDTLGSAADADINSTLQATFEGCILQLVLYRMIANRMIIIACGQVGMFMQWSNCMSMPRINSKRIHVTHDWSGIPTTKLWISGQINCNKALIQSLLWANVCEHRRCVGAHTLPRQRKEHKTRQRMHAASPALFDSRRWTTCTTSARASVWLLRLDLGLCNCTEVSDWWVDG